MSFVVFRAEGIVLRTRDLGEADKIVTLYTRTHGKVVAVARGARRIRNRLLGPTQVFTHGRYLLFKGKNLDTLSQGEIIQSHQVLREDLDLMAYAMYLAELVDVLVEEGDPHPETFFLLLNTIQMGCQGRFAQALLAFELRFMKYLGYEPELYGCIYCGQVPDSQVGFSPEGGIVCPNCFANPRVVRMSKGTWQLMKPLLEWEFSRISILHPSTQALQELRHLLRLYIDFRLERPLKSLEFLDTIVDFPIKEVGGK